MASEATGELRCPFGGGGPATAPGARPKPKRGYLIPGTIALVVCAAIGVVIDVTGLQTHTPDTLAAGNVDALVSQSLQAAAAPTASPPQVHCPGSEPERTGLTFSCALTLAGGGHTTVTVTELGDGNLRVTPPAS